MADARGPLAIVGVSALFPGSTGAQGFWRDILAGRDLITEVPETHWLVDDYYDPDPKAPDKTYARRGGFLSEVEFDPLEHGVPPSIAPATDTSQLLALIVAKQVLDEATGGQFTHVSKERVSVILGVTSAQELLIESASRLQRPVWVKALREHGLPEDEVQAVCDRIASSYTPWQESTFPGLLGNVVAGRIANRLDLGGTNCVTDAACASSFSALQMAASELWLGQSDLAIVGGVETLNDIFMYMCFSKTPALSPSGECRPFGEGADGTLLGEGLGMMAVRRLEDAERDGDRVYAVIRGIGSSSDGRAKSVYAPLPEGQARALRRAYEAAGYGPDTVELVEAHGTGTRAGDAAEFEGLRQVFDETGRQSRQWCALGTVKSQIGHTKAAAGAAGLFKAVMAVHHGVLPPTLGADRPNPALGVEKSPFYLSSRSRPWVRDARHPRRASVSSFGFGGSNFHVAIEAYTGTAPRARRYWDAPSELVLLSADGAAELAQRCRALAGEARPGRLAFLAHRSQDRFDAAQPARAAVVASDEAALSARLERVAAHLTVHPDRELATPDGAYAAVGAAAGRVAFLFPGQGSQYRDMGAEVAMRFPVARAAWDAAAAVALPEPLHDVVFPRPASDDAAREAQDRKLTATEWAQPAIGVASQALLAVLRAVGVAADACAGHSFGELVALHAAGALDAATLVRLARRRGERMAEAAGERDGAMLAVPLEAGDIEARLSRWGLDLALANRNAPRQNVLSGETAAVVEAARRFEEDGVAVRRLPVSTAFHSPLVEPAVAAFAADLADAEVGAPALPVPSNRDARPWPDDPAGVRRQLAEQIARPVRFVETVEALWSEGVRTFVEVGPNAVLTRLVGECLGDRPHRTVALDQRGRDGVTSLWHGLARLAVAGVPVRGAALREDVVPVEDPETRPAKAHALRISGANYRKPYPPPGGAAALPPPNPPRPAAAVPVEEPLPAAAAPPAAPAPPAVAAGRPVSSDAVAAWLEVQRQTAEVHETYLRTLGEAHAAFLRAATAAQAALVGAAADAGVSTPEWPPAGEPHGATPAVPTAVSRTPEAPPPPEPARVPTREGTRAATPSHLGAVLLEVVADKTGYPADMLQPDMQLEADLGVDSIKRVEILASLQERVPDLPEVQPADVASLRTLGQIADFLGAAAPAVAPASPAPSAKPVPGPATPAQAAELGAVLLEVVADKTGYPADMLQPDMQLEADLGVDSIKRVEILASLQERVPGLPEVQPADVAGLRTLGQIADFLGATAPATAPESPAPSAMRSADPVADLGAVLLEVVADKTGYPAEMLQPDMQLEADLGVDSIKRVEILASLQERVPDLPEVQPADVARLRTLGQIADFLGAPPPAATEGASPAATPVAAPTPAAPIADLRAVLLEVVADKTGYPAEMLQPDMQLEADLGVDSIKRVEILASLQERVPDLPEVQPADVARLRTLGQIADFVASGTATPEESRPAPVTRRVVRAVSAGTAAGTGGLPRDLPVLVRDGGSGLGPALAERLRRAGLAAGEGSAPGGSLIVLDGLAEPADPIEAVELQRRAFGAVRDHLRDGAGGVVTVQDTGGDFGLGGRAGDRAWLGGLPGMIKTAAQEHPERRFAALDLERGGRTPEELVEAIARALLEDGGATETGLRADGSRTHVVADTAPASASGGLPGPGDVLVVTGGGRGVTAACARALARAARPALALLGRTPLADEPAGLGGIREPAALQRALVERAVAAGRRPAPAQVRREAQALLAARELRENIAAIRATGARVVYHAVDVSDPQAVSSVLARVRSELGPITGVIHGAGALADRRLAEKTDADLDRVLAPKVVGLRALLHATRDDALRWLVLFSSVAARAGNPGQADYALANEILNQVAAAEAARRGPGVCVRALGWGPWEGGMVDATLAARFRERGIPLIGIDAGATAFLDELRSAEHAPVVVLGEAPALAPPPPTPLAKTPRSAELPVLVGAQSHAYLDAHRIRGVPVVPLALALDWMARAAARCRPDLALLACRDVQVRSGIRLDRFAAEGHALVARAREVSNGAAARLALELSDADGNLRYTATAEMGPGTTAPQAPPAAAGTRASAAPWSADEVYDGDRLFHGPAFHVIRSLEGLDDEGGVAVLAGLRELGWPEEAWQLDAAALDGCLQLALLHARLVLGGATLPTGLGTLLRHAPGPIAGPLRCALRVRSRSALQVSSDALLTDAAGQLLLELHEVQVTALPAIGDPAARSPVENGVRP